MVTKIVEIDGGELTTYSGNYDFYEQQRELAREEQHEAQFARQEAALAKERAFIERFKARASHAAQVQSRVKKLDKIDKIAPPAPTQGRSDFEFPKPPRSGDDVVRCEGLAKALRRQGHLRGLRLDRASARALGDHGRSTAPASRRCSKLIAGRKQPDSGHRARSARA